MSVVDSIAWIKKLKLVSDNVAINNVCIFVVTGFAF